MREHTLFVVMELLPVTLHVFIRERVQQRANTPPFISRAEFITVASGIMDALVFMHDKFVVHRDLKAGECGCDCFV